MVMVQIGTLQKICNMNNPDPYYSRKEVSNSDLSSLKEMLYPKPSFGDKQYAYAFGTLLDCMITEPEKVDYYSLTVDGQYKDYRFTAADFELAKEMKKSYMKDSFCKMINENADFQSISVSHDFPIVHNEFEFQLSAGVRCKWDLLVRKWNMGGDIKSTMAKTQKEFEQACDHFDYFRSRAWYMDIEGTNRDMLIGISKVNQNVFKIPITRGDKLYNYGKAQYQDLAFKYWLYVDNFAA